MQRKLAPPAAVVGSKGSRLHFPTLIGARHLCDDQTGGRALVIGMPMKSGDQFSFELLPTPYDSIRVHQHLLLRGFKRVERISAGSKKN